MQGNKRMNEWILINLVNAMFLNMTRIGVRIAQQNWASGDITIGVELVES